MATKLVKKIKFEYTITLVTGLHIGGSSDSVEIGGVDLPVIRVATKKGQPYIPGSSLKGKMRCLLEQVAGAKLGESKEVNNLFGFAKSNIPSRVIVRDAYLTKESATQLYNSKLDMPYTESKYENTIDRVAGATIKGGLRQIERVPAGAKFAAEIILNIWDDDNENGQIALLKKGISLIENDYLGGSGSRGYGQVKIEQVRKDIVYGNA